MPIIQNTAFLATLIASVSAHGYVSGIVADGTYYQGYSPSFQYQSTPPTVAGWSDPENLANGYVAPAAFADPDIICHLDATPGGSSAKVAAGGTVELQWTTWPESHHGPVIDYLAPVSGAWADVDKTSLEFFKISQGGLIDGSSAPGKWASDDLIANNNTWAVKIPSAIAAGKYVLRHEIIALHSAGEENGAQNYPQCVNLEITGSGTEKPSGTLGTTLYKETDPGILINIYTALSSYKIPGPALYSGAASGSQTGAATSTAADAKTASASSYVAASTTGVASSSPPPYANTSAVAAPTTTSGAASSSAPTPIAETTPSTTVDPRATMTDVAAATTYTSAAKAKSSAAPSSDSQDYQFGSLPAKDLPAGWTLKDLLEWTAYLTKSSWNKGVHARDFKSWVA